MCGFVWFVWSFWFVWLFDLFRLLCCAFGLLLIIMIMDLQFPSQSIQLTPPDVFLRYASFTYLWILPSRRAFYCRQLGAASGIALLPMPGWASLWLLFALSTLSSLRQAKIHWADSEEGARFTPFAFESGRHPQTAHKKSRQVALLPLRWWCLLRTLDEKDGVHKLLPCTASSTWTWMNQLATLGPCSATGMMQENYLLQLGVTWTCGNCYVIVKKYWALWGFYFLKA